MIVWISKNALSTGIRKAEVEPSDLSWGMVCEIGKGIEGYFHGEGKDWHRSRVSAVEKAEEMRAAKMASLKKQIAKLEKLTFAAADKEKG